MIVNYKFNIEDSKDKLKILKINKDNKEIYIGSKYRMKDCIDKLLNEDNKIQDDSIIILFGIGSGEYVKSLYNKNNNIKIIIFEPNMKLIEYIKENGKEFNILHKENISLLDVKTEGQLYKALASFIGEFDINKIQYRCLLNYDKIYSEQMLKFNKILKNFINDIVIKRNTGLIFHERWFNTLIDNLKYIVQSQPIDLFKNKYKNIPGIIVSAGPSLVKNIDELKKINDNFIILSGGRTLKPLMEKDVCPSLIGVVDPGETSYNLVKGYIEKTDAPLLFYEGTNEEVVKNHSGRKFIFTQNSMIEDVFNMRIANLGVGGSIAHTLTATALELGCNPIIFIGQDLAYTGEKYHADIAVNQFSNLEENKVYIDDIIYVEDINGSKVRTSEVLDSFRRELENIIENSKNTMFINATEGGAKIKGTTQMNLKEVINKYKSTAKVSFLDKTREIDKNKTRNNIIELLQKIIKSDEEIIKESDKALKIIKKIETYLDTKQSSKVNKYLKNLDIIDDKIKKSYEGLDILKTIIYPIIFNILSGKQSKTNKEIIENNKFLYQSILNVSKDVLEPIKNVKNEIEKMEIKND